MQGLGIGISDFKMLRIRDNYYIDKTMYIKDIIDNQSGVILITRPRRFGKTLNMSTLKYYFDCTQKDNQELFNGLKILEQEEKYTSKLGYYPVIYITLKDVQDTNYENMLLDMKTAMINMYKEHMYLLESDKIYDFEKKKIEDILYAREDVAKESIFSGANNFDVYTILNDEFSKDFGITEEEMEKVIKDLNIEEDKEKIKKWYDGYIIGRTEGIYNPWSILNYLKNKELVPYWVNTSSNDLIKMTLKNSATVKEKIERLLKDEEIEVPIKR